MLLLKIKALLVDLRPLGFDSSLQGVQSNQLDGMIAGMSITDERKETFDFSDPYFDSGIQMAVAKDNQDIKTYADLKDKTVGAKVGTESARFLETNQKNMATLSKTMMMLAGFMVPFAMEQLWPSLMTIQS